MSVLCFYRHIFFIKDSYRRASLALMVVAGSWYIATIIPSMLVCYPVESFWNRTMHGKCLNLNLLSFGTSIADTCIDLAILLLPVRMAFKLQLPLKTRIAVAGIFALGGFVVITNMMRVIYIYQSNQRYGSSYANYLARVANVSQCHLCNRSDGVIFTWLPQLCALASPSTNPCGLRFPQRPEDSSATTLFHFVLYSIETLDSHKTSPTFTSDRRTRTTVMQRCVRSKEIWNKTLPIRTDMDGQKLW
jgi:hypothetical protein